VVLHQRNTLSTYSAMQRRSQSSNDCGRVILFNRHEIEAAGR
jgi:hypothetical protein